MSVLAKLAHYLGTAADMKVDELADPKVQIKQATDQLREQHARLVEQAGHVLGNQQQLEMQLHRKAEEVGKLEASARQALTLAQQARSAGDEAKAQQFEQAAQTFATQLTTGEAELQDLHTMHDQAHEAAMQAQQAVDQNTAQLQQKLAESNKLVSQLEQTKMQEEVSKSLTAMSDLAAPGNVPSLDDVRDKIEKRYANALGASDLAKNSVEGRMLEVQAATTNMAGAARLEQLRASLNGGALSSGAATPAIGAGASSPSSSQLPA